MNITLNSVVSQPKELIHSKLDDEVILLGLETGKYYGLDPVGSRIWDLMSDPISITELCNELVKEYNVDQDTCEKDTIELIEDLFKNKLVMLHE